MSIDRYLRFENPKRSQSKPLLWPVYVWKVLYPEPRRLQLNLFQQAILGLARAQCRDLKEMAALLCLDPELVGFIIATQLMPNGWLDHKGALSKKGEQVLEQVEEYSEELRLGYAFQDGVAGAWLPRFSATLPEIEADDINTKGKGFPIFIESRDSGKPLSPFKIPHASAPDDGRNAKQLFDPYLQYRTDVAYANQREESSSLLLHMKMSSIERVDEAPQVMWLWTSVFADLDSARDFLVADPFGFQYAASWLRRPLEKALPKNHGLARYINALFSNGKAADVSAEQYLADLECDINLQILADFAWCSKVPELKEYLTTVLRQQTVLKKQDRNWQESNRSLLIETHNLAESVLHWMLAAFPVDVRRLPGKHQDAAWTKQVATSTLESLSLACLKSNVIMRLSSQKLNVIRTALENGKSSLKALLVAALLSTVEHANHPLRQLTAQQCNLEKLLNMADARNKKAGHASTEKISQKDALDYAAFVIQWSQLFKEYV